MAFTRRALRAGAAVAGITLTLATAPAAAATNGVAVGGIVRSERTTSVAVTTVLFKVRPDGTRIAVPVKASRVFPTVHYTLPGSRL